MERLKRFMSGRYGYDSLGVVLIVLGLLLSFVSRITAFPLLSIFAVFPTIYALYRILSKDIWRRQQENHKWLYYQDIFKKKWKKLWRWGRDFPKYKYFTCTHCKQTIRIPRGKGNLEISCPKCRHSFKGRT